MMDDGLISESIMKMWKRPKTKYKPPEPTKKPSKVLIYLMNKYDK